MLIINCKKINMCRIFNMYVDKSNKYHSHLNNFTLIKVKLLGKY